MHTISHNFRVKIGSITVHMSTLDAAIHLCVRLQRKGHPAVLTV